VTRSRLVLAAWALTMATGVAGLVLMAGHWQGGDAFTPHSLVSLGFATVGALIMVRRPHRIGTLFMGFGIFAAIFGLLLQTCALVEQGAAAAGGVCADDSRLAPLLWPMSYLFFGSLFLVFPSGKLPSRRWWPITLLFFGSWSSAAVGGLVMGDKWFEEHFGFVIPIAVWSLAVVALAPLFRIRRADPIERQQLRILAYVIGLTLLLIGIGIPLDIAGQQDALNILNLLIFTNVVLGIPGAIAIAILRYRLYDIDVIVNRTLVYAGLTAILALSYLGIVVLLQRLLDPFTAESDLAIAGSTLAVAALFRPVRERVQMFIDHRFYRRKYDAGETLQGFSARLRDEVDLDSLAEQLVGVVSATMQPSHASLWLRSTGEAR